MIPVCSRLRLRYARAATSVVPRDAAGISGLADIRQRRLAVGPRPSPLADEQVLHLLRRERRDRERLERHVLGSEPLQRDHEVAAPEVRGDVRARVHDGADHRLQEAEVLGGAVGPDDAGSLSALDQLRGERVELRAELARPVRRLRRRPEQQLLEAAVPRLVLQQLLVSPDDALPGVGVGERLLEQRRQLRQVLDGYRAMNERESIKVLVRP